MLEKPNEEKATHVQANAADTLKIDPQEPDPHDPKTGLDGDESAVAYALGANKVSSTADTSQPVEQGRPDPNEPDPNDPKAGALDGDEDAVNHGLGNDSREDR